jgi:hypothetical protein
MLSHPVYHRRQVERGFADPARQCGTMQIKAGAIINLTLPVERQMIRVFADQHMSKRPFGGQCALDQMRGGPGLSNDALAGRAGIFRSDRHEDTQLGGHDIKALGTVFADPHHLAAAAGAKRAVRLDELLNPWQVFGQIAKVAFGLLGLFVRCILLQAGLIFLGLGNCHLKVFESELAIVKGELFGLLAVKRVVQFLDQMLKLRIGLLEDRDL